ncbi:UNVERIFIED_CONTAM: hypothetical protein FKN15_032307 [Acipenser sinensis]
MQSEVTVGEGLPTASEIDTFENVTVFDRLSSNGCCSIEIEYPEELSSAKARKNYKDRVLRESPETLIANYSTVDNCRVKCNLLLYTEHPSAWHSALCSTYCNIRKGGIGRGRQLTVFEDSDADSVMLTVNIYHNGTVMVQGRESSLDLFENSFPALRERVERAKTVPELATPQPLPQPPAQPSSQPPHPQHSPVTDSPRQVSNIRALKECLSVLELQFTEFREHTEHKLATLSQASPSEQLRDEVYRLKTEHKAEVQERARERSPSPRRVRPRWESRSHSRSPRWRGRSRSPHRDRRYRDRSGVVEQTSKMSQFMEVMIGQQSILMSLANVVPRVPEQPAGSIASQPVAPPQPAPVAAPPVQPQGAWDVDAVSRDVSDVLEGESIEAEVASQHSEQDIELEVLDTDDPMWSVVERATRHLGIEWPMAELPRRSLFESPSAQPHQSRMLPTFPDFVKEVQCTWGAPASAPVTSRNASAFSMQGASEARLAFFPPVDAAFAALVKTPTLSGLTKDPA